MQLLFILHMITIFEMTHNFVNIFSSVMFAAMMLQIHIVLSAFFFKFYLQQHLLLQQRLLKDVFTAKMNLGTFFMHSFNRSFHIYAQLERQQRSVTVCKISFLPVVLVLECLIIQCQQSRGICQAASVRQLARTLTHSASQSGGRRGMCGKLLPISATRWSPLVLL